MNERDLSRSASRLDGVILVRNMAIQDWVVVGFCLYMTVLSWWTPESREATIARLLSTSLLALATVTLVATRGELLNRGALRSIVYRVGLFGAMASSYFLIRWLNPAQGRVLDQALYRIDLLLFHVTPSVWLERFNEPAIVEWFAFFYWSYFSLMAVVVLPTLFFGKGRAQRELFAGVLTVAALGHIGYTLVPGYGPYQTLSWAEPVAGGFWWDQVCATVFSGGAMMDIFPSLHTAYPMFYALWAFGNRGRSALLKWTWPILAFFSVNMIFATMFLRWHWGIDVIFGALLAVTAQQIGVYVAHREANREREGIQPVWEPIRRRR